MNILIKMLKRGYIVQKNTDVVGGAFSFDSVWKKTKPIIGTVRGMTGLGMEGEGLYPPGVRANGLNPPGMGTVVHEVKPEKTASGILTKKNKKKLASMFGKGVMPV